MPSKLSAVRNHVKAQTGEGRASTPQQGDGRNQYLSCMYLYVLGDTKTEEVNRILQHYNEYNNIHLSIYTPHIIPGIMCVQSSVLFRSGSPTQHCKGMGASPRLREQLLKPASRRRVHELPTERLFRCTVCSVLRRLFLPSGLHRPFSCPLALGFIPRKSSASLAIVLASCATKIASFS